MTENAVERVTLRIVQLEGAADLTSVEVRRITIAPDVHVGTHWHNGPVFGVIESGSAHFQVGSDAESVLRAGDTFYEPGAETITRFDATHEGVTFVAWFPVPSGTAPELTPGEPPSPRNDER